jgi:sister-chromatid-cohesion protein PDS5
MYNCALSSIQLGDGLKSIDVFQENTKCSVVSERVSNESAPEREACSSLSKSVGQNASGSDKGKRSKHLASGKRISY